MDAAYLHPLGILDGSLSPMTALCFMWKEDFTYLLGGSCHGCFWIYDMATRTKLNQIVLDYAIIAIHHHPTDWYEIITQELLGRLTFWSLGENFRFVAYHTVFVDTHPPLTIIASNHILFPQNYKIRMMSLEKLKRIVPMTRDLCELVDWEFGRHTTMNCIEIEGRPYVISGYTSGSIIIREFRLGGLVVRLCTVRPSSICSIAYNREKQELIISDDDSVSLAVLLLYADEDGAVFVQKQQEIFVGGGKSILTMEPTSTYLLCGREHGMMKIINWRTSKCLPISPLQLINSIQVIISSPYRVAGWDDSFVFAVAYTNGFISLWKYDNYVRYVPYVI